jgi:hypothetical protein
MMPAPAAPSPTTTPTPAATPPGLPPDVPRQGTFVFYEDFERNFTRWSLEGGAQAVGWVRLNAFTCGGAWTMLLGTAGWEPFQNARGQAVLRLREPLDLRDARRPYLLYDVRGETVPPEAISLQPEVSRDGEAWQPIGAAAQARYRYVSRHHADLSPHRGQRLHLRFKATFDVGATPSLGLLFDDVHVLEPS